MSGIVFFDTERHDAVVEFYVDAVGAAVWKDQPGCTILDRDGFRFGFCDRETTDDCGILTFVSPDREGVDAMHERLSADDVGGAPREQPHYNETYEIYQFFGSDPDGRTVEFQTFEDG